MSIDLEERVVCRGVKFEQFYVKSLYEPLESRVLLSFPWRAIWNPCVPCKVVYFSSCLEAS